MLFLNYLITKSKNKIKSTHLLKKSNSGETSNLISLCSELGVPKGIQVSK
jgi:hypothetical protein